MILLLSVQQLKDEHWSQNFHTHPPLWIWKYNIQAKKTFKNFLVGNDDASLHSWILKFCDNIVSLSLVVKMFKMNQEKHFIGQFHSWRWGNYHASEIHWCSFISQNRILGYTSVKTSKFTQNFVCFLKRTLCISKPTINNLPPPPQTHTQSQTYADPLLPSAPYPTSYITQFTCLHMPAS
jgi:hypothetical protein